MSLTYSQLNARMNEIPLKSRNIGQFCGFLIYDGKCGQKNCDRMHTLNLDFIRLYLDDDKVKSVLCAKGAHCTHFVCRFGHDYDHDILGRSDPDDPDHTVFEHDEEHRETARRFWREAKQEAYNIELLSGDRQPKNKRDMLLLERLRNEVVSFNQENFPPLPASPEPLPLPLPIPVEITQPALTIAPLKRSMATGDVDHYQSDQDEEDYNAQANFAIDQANFHLTGIHQHFINDPSCLQNPVVNQLYQIACSQNQLLNM